MAGKWEFPGGKIRPGEPPFVALQRELAEELAIAVQAAKPILNLSHDYSDRRVNLDIWLVEAYAGVPVSNEGQELRWAQVNEISSLDLLAADAPIIAALRSHFSGQLEGPG
jgi:8-oxo-dGTP diphosphatase